MRTLPLSSFLVLLSLMPAVGCDVDDTTIIDDTELELRQPAGPPIRAYHGRWEGPMTHSGGNPSFDYDATIVLTPDICTIQAGDALSAEWDYYNLGVICTSELVLLGVGVAPDGTRTWTFYDHNLTGQCTDGFADLTETPDPAVMHHAWRNLGVAGAVDAEGLLTRNGLCTPGFGGGGD